MSTMFWSGVMPAITTPFRPDDKIDHDFLAAHANTLVDAGVTAIVALGSLGEGATLRFEEKIAVLGTLVQAVGRRVPVVAAVSALSTAEACDVARAAESTGCLGLMVLPPYVHKGPWSETQAHFDAVFASTRLSCMLYNNPAYGVDICADEIAAFAARHSNLGAVKDSTGDARRVSAVRALCGERLACFVGLDDMVLEGVAVGAVGWVAGLVNALPRESVVLFELARRGDFATAWDLYRWFLPLLRLDTKPEFVQLIKLVQQAVDLGSERVRPPRRPVEGDLREESLKIVYERLSARPRV